MASRGKTTQLHNMYVADFETCDTDRVDHIDSTTNEPVYEQRVWLAGYKNLDTLESTYFTSLEGFMQDILGRGDNTNTEYGFHNLKFDGSFIVPYLLKQGWIFNEGRPQAGEFSLLVDKSNNWYTITIQVTKRRKVTIWDTLKLFPSQLAYLHEVYSTPTKKIKEEQSFYTKTRPEGYVPDEQDMKYFENDLQVPAETLRKHIELFGLRFKKTQASQSFYNFEQSFKSWKLRFPPMSLEDDKDIRGAYWGGIAYVPPSKAGIDHYKIGVYDINSSYPDKLANYKLPYGHMLYEYVEGKTPDFSKFWVAEILVDFTLKHNHLPCIPKKAIIEGQPDFEADYDKWLDESGGVVSIRLSIIDYWNMCDSYDFTIYRWIWSKHWAWKEHREIARFVNKNNEDKVKYSKLAKKEKNPEKKAEYDTRRNRAKIDNNSFYGKFGEDIEKISKSPHLEEDDNVSWESDIFQILKEGKRKYLPVAMAVTAWGRRQLVQMANILGEDFLYCDTDSIHYLLSGQAKIDKAIEEGTFLSDPEKLGSWKFEGEMVKGRYLRAKCYLELNTDGHLEATVAGLPADPGTGMFSKSRSCLSFDNFHLGHVVPESKTNKLRTVRTKTGSKLLPTSFELKRKTTLF